MVKFEENKSVNVNDITKAAENLLNENKRPGEG